jgi:broad-specificity NMP kinase
MPKIYYDGKIINTISMNQSSSTHYLIEGMKKIKKTECLVIPFEKTDIVKYDNDYYQITDDAKINNNKIYYSISNLLKKNYSIIKNYQISILRKEEFLRNDDISDDLYDSINAEIESIRKEIEKETEKDKKIIVESNKLIELNKSISIEIKKYATYINSYNNCMHVERKIESIDFVIDLFKEINLSCNKIDEIKNRIYFTKNVKYEINNIIINPYYFIEEDWQLFNYNKALFIENIYEIESSDEIKLDEIRRNAWFYSFIHSANTFYIPINDFEINYNNNTCTIYKNSKKVNIQTLIKNNIFCLKIIDGKEYITTKFLINYEKSLGDLFLELFHDQNTKYEKILNIDIDEYIEQYQQLPGKNILNENQRNAVKTCLIKKFSVITGFPGTGKTNIVDCILYILIKLGITNISLCAPTGKAYNNMNKKTKQYNINQYNCGTVHTVLYKSFNNVEKSPHSDDTPKREFIIIDEISMLDIFMFKNVLLRAKMFGFQLILAGDKNQLPSVGPGTILKNIIESGIFLDNTTTLTEICRQSDGSLVNVIKKLANKDLFSIKDFDGITLKFIPLYPYKDDKENYIQNKIVSFNNANHLNYNNTKYLVYDNKTVTILNNILQIQFNENLSEITPPPYSTHLKQIFKVKDRIILKHNDTQTSIINNNDGSFEEEERYRANGDEATIYSYDNTNKIVSLYYEGDGDELTEISVTDLYNLYDLSYCLTIHKSQGSQYENIVLILDNSYNMTKNALFTAISRAEKKCFIFAKDKNDIISIQYKEDFNKISLFLEEFNEYELQ